MPVCLTLLPRQINKLKLNVTVMIVGYVVPSGLAKTMFSNERFHCTAQWELSAVLTFLIWNM
jgi:hypothetical protein